jgi:hypothetical protein
MKSRTVARQQYINNGIFAFTQHSPLIPKP